MDEDELDEFKDELSESVEDSLMCCWRRARQALARLDKSGWVGSFLWTWGLGELVDQLGESSQLDVDFDQGFDLDFALDLSDPCKGYEYEFIT